MKEYVNNIEKEALDNSNFRKVLYTDSRVQLVVMSLLPKEDIGEEVHETSNPSVKASLEILDENRG